MPQPLQHIPATLHFDDFDTLSRQEWKRLIVQTLKAETEEAKHDFYTQKLIQNPEPGVRTAPFYTPEDMTGLEYLQGFYRLWTQTRQTTGWMNTARIAEPDAAEANRQVRQALASGADALWFDAGTTDLEQMLEGVPLSETPIYFEAQAGLLPYLAAHAGPLMGGLAGRADAETAAFCSQAPYFKTLFALPGGLFVEQLVEGLLQAVRHVEAMQAAGLAAAAVLPGIGFTTSVGSHYFLEIAKLRALRLLWWQVGRLYDPHLNLVDVLVHARTVPPPSAEDPYKTLVSNTTQAMSAIIGGCDALSVVPAHGLPQGEEAARRIARNVPAILKEESYFDKVTDPAAGSYLVENLTHQLAEAAWNGLKSGIS